MPSADHVLRGAFSWAAARRLSAVDLDPDSSNQHELGSAGRLHRHLVHEGILLEQATEARLQAQWLVLEDDTEPVPADEDVTLYDSRRHSPHRHPEWRLYYRAGGEAELLLAEHAEPGDLVVYAVPSTGVPNLIFLVAAAGSQWERSLTHLFPMDGASQRLQLIPQRELLDAQGHAAARLIAEFLGVGIHDVSDIEWLEERLGTDLGTVEFPNTRAMATMARERLGPWQGGSPDQHLLDLLDTETRLFYALENVQALPRFRDECHTTEDFLELAKSLLQRRRARRGYSFELHLEGLFSDAGLAFETQVPTEPGTRVDFLFPDLDAYVSAPEPLDHHVVHMNAKSTTRERWKQVLKEATRLTQRHLGTLDPNMSTATIRDATESGVRVVVPEPVADLYPVEAQRDLWTLQDFVAHVSSMQQPARR